MNLCFVGDKFFPCITFVGCYFKSSNWTGEKYAPTFFNLEHYKNLLSGLNKKEGGGGRKLTGYINYGGSGGFGDNRIDGSLGDSIIYGYAGIVDGWILQIGKRSEFLKIYFSLIFCNSFCF